MNIFNHLIPDASIRGIGPLMVEQTTDTVSNQLYGTRRYFFDLHLVAHTTQIKSDWYTPRSDAEDFNRMQDWKEHYFLIRKKVASLIEEDPEVVDHTKKTDLLPANSQ